MWTLTALALLIISFLKEISIEVFILGMILIMLGAELSFITHNLERLIKKEVEDE
jgi:hypothetical protein